MTARSMLRRKTREVAPAEPATLSAELTFLQVVLDACQHSGRYTLIAESDGATYTVMIDRGGPFNATGGGLTGSPALQAAALLRSGTYSVIEGWPVEQPLYQLGLDDTLLALSSGTRPEAKRLPAARGVDALRNGAWTTIAQEAAPTSDITDAVVKPMGSWLVPEAPAPMGSPAPNEAEATDGHVEPSTNGNGTAPAEYPQTPFLGDPAILDSATAKAAAPSPEVVETADVLAPAEAPEGLGPAVEQGLAVEPAVVVEPEVLVEPEVVETTPEVIIEHTPLTPHSPITYVDESARWLREAANEAAATDPTAATEGSRRQGRIGRAVIAFLLWTVQVDNDGQTLGQALGLVGHALRSAFGAMLEPIDREVFRRWHRARDDWRRSGEAVAKQKNRAARKPTGKPR